MSISDKGPQQLPQLSGFVCAYHPVAPGSNPKHTIYPFSVCIIDIVMIKGQNKLKEAGIGLFKKVHS